MCAMCNKGEGTVKVCVCVCVCVWQTREVYSTPSGCVKAKQAEWIGARACRGKTECVKTMGQKECLLLSWCYGHEVEI